MTRRTEGIPRASANGAYAVAVDPDDPRRLWISIGPYEFESSGHVVAESADNGANWRLRTNGLPDRLHRRLLLVPSARPGSRRLLVTVADMGVFASPDGGNTWAASSTGLPHVDIRDLVADPLEPGVYWCALAGSGTAPGSVYRSSDAGASWTRVSGETLRAQDIMQMVISRTDPRRQYLAARRRFLAPTTFPGGIFRSDDGGASWRQVLNDQYARAVAVDPLDADLVYAGLRDDPYHDDSRGGGLRLSRDGGNTWTQVGGLPNDRISVITVDPHDRSRVFVGTAGNGVLQLSFAAAISSGGIVNGASFQGGPLTPGSIVSIFGANLATATAQATIVPLPRVLLRTSVTFNGVAAPLYFVSPTQLNVQVPWELSGSLVRVEVLNDGVASPAVTMPLGAAAPGVFVVPLGSRSLAAVLHNSTGTLVTPEEPARPGEILQVFATGLGAVTPPVASGAAAPGDPLSVSVVAPKVTVGGVESTVLFSGLAPGFVGLYQVNIRLANETPSGPALPILLTVGNAGSNQPALAVER